jgi:hypothetical protein
VKCESNPAPYKGLLSIKYRSGDFRGRLKAITGFCERHRRIKVIRVVEGRSPLIGKDHTNRRGRYKVHEGHANGRFYAKSKAKVSAGGKCKRDFSYRIIRV